MLEVLAAKLLGAGLSEDEVSSSDTEAESSEEDAVALTSSSGTAARLTLLALRVPLPE